MEIWNKFWNMLFPKRYYLTFVKAVSTSYSNGVTGKKNLVVTVLYRKKNKEGKRKFFINHNLHSDYLVSWWVVKWWMLLIRVYGRKSKRLFAYKLPNGTVYLKKVEV